MKQHISENSTAIIILHEIYGLNTFIKEIAMQYHQMGYDVFCPSLYKEHQVFSYDNAENAYDTFMTKVGFDCYMEINKLIIKLKETHAKVFVLGFSVGATLAWRCSENESCDGVICCYGSRIRDYLTVNPRCPVLLAFAKQDSFDVISVIEKLQVKDLIAVAVLNAKHGFMDPYSVHYSEQSAQILHDQIEELLR